MNQVIFLLFWVLNLGFALVVINEIPILFELFLTKVTELIPTFENPHRGIKSSVFFIVLVLCGTLFAKVIFG